MNRVRVKTASVRSDLAELLTKVRNERSRVYVMRHKDVQAVIMSEAEADELDRLRSMYRFHRAQGLLS